MGIDQLTFVLLCKQLGVLGILSLCEYCNLYSLITEVKQCWARSSTGDHLRILGVAETVNNIDDAERQGDLIVSLKGSLITSEKLYIKQQN